MGRLPRAIDEGLVYHALNRGNNRSDVLADDADRDAFLVALARTKARYPFRLFGYCLMSNHFHLLLRPEPGQTVSRILQSLTVAHTWRYHRHHRSSGHVWQGRFRSPVIQDDMHLLVVLRYIEANPLRAGIVADPADYRWCSYRCHGSGQDDPLLDGFPEWEELGGTEAERRRRWRAKVRGAQPAAELEAVRHSLSSGQPFGAAAWSDATAKRLNLYREPRPRGRPRKKMV
jgi:putative transposase